MLRVRLLGGLAVSRAGVAVPVAGTPARLLGFLALHRELMHREAVAARLWPERAADVGRANLRTTVWALRKAVGAEAVVASRGEVGLAPQRVWVDVAEIVALGERGESRAAVELCRGELLPEFGDDWACQARAAHHERHAALLDQLAQQAEANHDPSSAVRWSRLRCALDPLNEPAHCRLVCRLAAAGDRAGGLVEGREFTERLWAELRVAPGPEMRAVLAELRQTHSAVSLGRADSARRHHLPMFGRSAELAQVMAAWAHARTGAGRAMLITGEGGIGKTRLVREVARRVAGSGARVAVGAGVDVGGQAPLAIWQELTRELVATIPPPPHGVGWPGELGRLAPDLASALGHPGVPPPVAAPELERLRVFDAVLRLLEWAAAHQPVLLVAEDLHRSDPTSP